MRSDRICRTTFSCALIVLALRQFCTARPSEITPIVKIATPSRTSYRANAYFDLERLRTGLAGMIGVLECWKFHYPISLLLHHSIGGHLAAYCVSSACAVSGA